MPNTDISITNALPVHMSDIQSLWRKNSKTLGFFPAGAFDDAISKGGILVAFIENTLVGYLLFRQSRGRVTIVHLCIHETYQRQGVARKLVKALTDKTQAALGIGLKCRTDFSVNSIWPHLGFIARDELKGRNMEGKPLTCWWKDNGGLSLESLWIEEALAGKIAVALDANVFFDLVGEETQRTEESKSLLADWLQDSIELCLTPEIFNEVHRRKDPHQREQNRAAISLYTNLKSNPQIFERSLKHLSTLFPSPTRESDNSDLRQIAHAVAAEVSFFVTRDEEILERADPIYEATGVRVLRPATLITHLDELRREIEYRPVQFAATDIECQRVGQHDLNGKEELFQRSIQGETKAILQAQLNNLLSRPNEVNSLRVFNDTQGELGILFTTLDGDTLKVPMIRVREIPSAPSSAPTIARSLSSRLINIAVKNRSRLILVADPYISPTLESAFLEDGFFKTELGLLRHVLPTIGDSEELVAFTKETGNRNSWVSENDQNRATRLMDASLIGDPKQAALAEDSLWPTRILDASLNTYIVPIKPHWAKELFDEDLASQTIFGALTKLLLNRESVYYRSARPSGIKAPARILWYVSQDNRFQNAGSIRACSSLQEVHVGSAKTLFSQFRRLGVFQWHDLMNVTNDEAEGKLMALKFGSTFNFQSPVPWSTFQEILRNHDCKGQIQSPHPITNEAFVEIFKMGM